MIRNVILSIFLMLSMLLYGCRQPVSVHNQILQSCYKLKPLTKKSKPITAGSWRATYTEVQEPISFYFSKNPPRITNKRKALYVIQLNDFDPKAKQLIRETKAYLASFYQIPVKELPPADISTLPEQYSRQNTFGIQIKTTILLDSLLPSLLPDDAFALIALTRSDLYPSDDWNYVFGQASLSNRVGVWSIARLGNYNESDSAYNLCRKRTLHIAAHETGHILGIKHCVVNECCMNGSISLQESDSQRPWLCWQCLAKVCLNRHIFPIAHIKALLDFHVTVTHDQAQIRYYQQALQLLKQQS